jgi:hypothetical protein
MVNLLPTAADNLAVSATRITDTIPSVSNGIILADSTCTAGRAAINFYCSSNPLSKTCFGLSFLFGVAGAASSGTALITSTLGIPVTGIVGSFGARAFNRLGKYTLHMGNVTNGNITNVTDIANLMN